MGSFVYDASPARGVLIDWPHLPREMGQISRLDLPMKLCYHKTMIQLPDISPEEEEQAAFEEMERDPDAPLTDVILRVLLVPERVGEVANIVLLHLVRDLWSRTTLRQALRIDGAQKEHPAYTLLLQAESEILVQ